MKRMVLFLLPLLMWSCSSDEDMIKVKRDLANLQEQIYRLETVSKANQDELDGTLAEIRELLADRTSQADQREQVNLIQETLARLEARLADVETRASRQSMNSSQVSVSNSSASIESDSNQSNEAVAGSDVEIQFRTSYGDFARGKYELAAYGFEELLNNFPNSPLTEQCHYYLGRSYYETKDYQKANGQFAAVIQSNNAKSDFKRPAMLYQGKCFYYLNMHNKAIAQLSDLVKNYPGTQESELARSFMRKAGYEN